MKVVGISLIKNEDLYIETVIKNVSDFCDELIVLDNNSEDQTYEIVSRLAGVNPKIKLFRIDNPNLSHGFIEKYAGNDTWIFRIDGDEVYDRKGLLIFKEKLMSGSCVEWFNVQCQSLNVESLDSVNSKATGYLSAMSSFSNFSLLKSWHESQSERLHGSNRIFNEKYNVNKIKYQPFLGQPFEKATLRCLHLCFLKRSSIDNEKSKLNPSESKLFFSNLINFLRNLSLGRLSFSSYYKNKYYKKGDLVTVDISTFFTAVKE